jgi:hypothetical protein
VPAFLEANDIRIQLNSDVETDEEEEVPSMDSDDAGSEYVVNLILDRLRSRSHSFTLILAIQDRDWI